MILLGDAVDAFYRHTLHWDECIFQCCQQFFRQVALNVFLDKNLIDFFSRLYSFNNGSCAEYHFILFKHRYNYKYVLLFFIHIK